MYEKIKDFTPSDKLCLFYLLSIIGEHFPHFVAGIRAEERLGETTGKATTPALNQCLDALVDESKAQANATHEAAMLAGRPQQQTQQQAQSQQPRRVPPVPNGKHCTLCNKERHLESECYAKHPHLKAEHDAKIKALKAAKQAAKAQEPTGQSHAGFNTGGQQKAG
ncbi:hypothetical protein TI39_contig620g00002 [Zymoseptoria brevis]|uniref:Uncharacterized protein n=1 Tax=Zymoseptoria brevis TaxID=1047168 RepID=A0A0F4GGU8_9PEZI|nr:hypothetical protein TI39_contig620g00002 [Zymoseptoria brevis]